MRRIRRWWEYSWKYIVFRLGRSWIWYSLWILVSAGLVACVVTGILADAWLWLLVVPGIVITAVLVLLFQYARLARSARLFADDRHELPLFAHESFIRRWWEDFWRYILSRLGRSWIRYSLWILVSAGLVACVVTGILADAWLWLLVVPGIVITAVLVLLFQYARLTADDHRWLSPFAHESSDQWWENFLEYIDDLRLSRSWIWYSFWILVSAGLVACVVAGVLAGVWLWLLVVPGIVITAVLVFIFQYARLGADPITGESLIGRWWMIFWRYVVFGLRRSWIWYSLWILGPAGLVACVVAGVLADVWLWLLVIPVVLGLLIMVQVSAVAADRVSREKYQREQKFKAIIGSAHGKDDRISREPSLSWEHYLIAEMPPRNQVLTEFSLIVRIVGKRPSFEPSGQVLLKPFEIGSQGTKVTVTVQAPRTLVPTEPLQQIVLVPRSGDSEPVRFAFRSEQIGAFRVRVTAFAGGTFLGELEAQVSIEERPPPTAASRLTADLESLRSERGEVTMQVRFDGSQYTFQLLSDSFFSAPVVAEALAAQPGDAVERALMTLRAIADRKSGYSDKTARTWMQETGIGLWNEMVPDLIREQFWQLRPNISSFSIASGRDIIPWELLYPLSPSAQDAGFLVEQFPVLRRAYGQRRCRRLSLTPALWIVPPKSPTNAQEEVRVLQTALSLNSAEGISDLASLLALINAGDAGLLHFACHNNFAFDAGGSTIKMDGGNFVPSLLNRAVTLRSLAKHSPLVFINACRSGGAVPEYTKLLGWAGQFMAAGAGAFVGTLWAVPSGSARVFAEAFYDNLVLKNLTLGTAILESRRAVASTMADPTWLSYTVYGDPAATAKMSSPNHSIEVEL